MWLGASAGSPGTARCRGLVVTGFPQPTELGGWTVSGARWVRNCSLDGGPAGAAAGTGERRTPPGATGCGWRVPKASSAVAATAAASSAIRRLLVVAAVETKGLVRVAVVMASWCDAGGRAGIGADPEVAVARIRAGPDLHRRQIGDDDAMQRRLLPALAASATALVLVTGMVLALGDPHERNLPKTASGWVVEVVLFLGGVALTAAGTWCWWRRPGNRCGVLLVAVGCTAGLLQGCYYAGPAAWADIGSLVAIYSFRPLTGWLLLAWPAGRLRRNDAIGLVVYTVAVLAFGLPGVLFAERSPTASLVIVPIPALGAALSSIANLVVYPVGAVWLLVTIVRRRRALPLVARPATRPVVVAAAAAVLADCGANAVVAFIASPIFTEHGLTVLGLIRALADLGRFLLTGLAFGWAVRGRLLFAPSGTRRVDVGPVERAPTATALLVARTGDAAATVQFPRGRAWIDPDGHRIGATTAPGRTLTRLDRAGHTIAAIDLDSAFDDRPLVLEAAGAAVAATVELERLQALASARLDEVGRARLAVLDAEDTTRRRLERDLHDGAQQRLVGLALLARLAAQPDAPDLAEIDAVAEGLAMARRDLEALADGVMPVVLADEGLAQALRTLAVTTPLGVSIDLDLPDDLTPGLAGTVWFVITESVTNAVKHARATRLTIDVRAVGDLLRLSVADDGVGGADLDRGSGLAGLRSRVEHAGGRCDLASPPGGGTRLDVSIPLLAPLAAGIPSAPGRP